MTSPDLLLAQIERIAEWLYARDAEGNELIRTTWADDNNGLRDRYRNEARAFIESLRAAQDWEALFEVVLGAIKEQKPHLAVDESAEVAARAATDVLLGPEEPISTYPREVPDDVQRAAHYISLEAFGQSYRPGDGPLSWGTGSYHWEELLRKADQWVRMAEAARVCGEWLREQEHQEATP